MLHITFFEQKWLTFSVLSPKNQKEHLRHIIFFQIKVLKHVIASCCRLPKKFINVFVGMPDIMNDVCILWIASLYRKVVNGDLFWQNWSEENIQPYILGDKGYPLCMPWLMIYHEQVENVHHTILETFYNKQLNQCRSDWKFIWDFQKSFRKLLLKTNLHILILSNVVGCCCILYNMILEVKDFKLETSMIQLELKNKINVNDVPSRRKSNGRVPIGQTAHNEV